MHKNTFLIINNNTALYYSIDFCQIFVIHIVFTVFFFFFLTDCFYNFRYVSTFQHITTG